MCLAEPSLLAKRMTVIYEGVDNKILAFMNAVNSWTEIYHIFSLGGCVIFQFVVGIGSGKL